jgi:putative phosphoesterase
MPLVGIISDVHADVHALRDALAHLDAMGCDCILCAGDLVDYGRFPEETLALVHQRGVACVRGNHDRWRLRDPGNVSAASQSYLMSLPETLRVAIGEVRFLVVHGTPRSDMGYVNEDEPSTTTIDGWFTDHRVDVIVCGHTHVALVRRCEGGKMLVNPGMLLRDPLIPGGWVTGSYGVFDTATREFETHRLPPPEPRA